MRTLLLAPIALTICIGLVGSAYAANVTSINPQSIVVALQDAGYKAAMTKTDGGDPAIDTASDGHEVTIAMSDCTNHQSCTTSEFVGIWDCSDSVAECKQVASEFNNEESPAKALSEKDGKLILVCYYLIYDEAGISEALFKKNFETFNFYNNEFTNSVAKKLGHN